jgi:hypothetical protein
MGGLYIRLDNKFIYKKGKKYYVTNITKKSEWTKMNKKQKERCMGKDVTSKVKELIKQYGSKVNMNFKTKASKKKIRTKRRSKKKIKITGGN